jgi:hypothetical protein
LSQQEVYVYFGMLTSGFLICAGPYGPIAQI